MTTNPSWPPLTPDLFGPLVCTSDVRDAVKATLQLWSPAYIAEMRARKSLAVGQLPDFQDWTVRPEYRSLPTTIAAACMVTCPGTLKAPERRGDGSYLVHYGVQVSVLAFGADWEPTEDTVGYYTTAVIAALLQHKSLDGFAQSTTWLGNRYGVSEHSSTRTLGAAQINFDVGVQNVLNDGVGPAQPTVGASTTPPPLVQDIDITFEEPS